MAMGRPKAVLVLDAELREQLESLANSRSLPAGLVRRAKIILLSASGKTNVEIARQLETSKVTVSLWPNCRRDRSIEIDGAPHLASVWLAAASAKTVQAFERSIFCRKGTGYCRAVLESTGKCSGFVRR